MAVTLERLSLAVGIVLAKTWRATVRRQPDSGRHSGSEDWAAAGGAMGVMTKPKGRRGTAEGSSPLMASWMASTSMVAYTTRLPESSVQLSCNISSTL
nr:hypothetical protein Itr_chr15CG02070 [Ipomoea trifida]GME00057.1 hypothetical protein Iba_chr15fCG1710 [Ipomoea batatas]